MPGELSMPLDTVDAPRVGARPPHTRCRHRARRPARTACSMSSGMTRCQGRMPLPPASPGGMAIKDEAGGVRDNAHAALGPSVLFRTLHTNPFQGGQAEAPTERTSSLPWNGNRVGRACTIASRTSATVLSMNKADGIDQRRCGVAGRALPRQQGAAGCGLRRSGQSRPRPTRPPAHVADAVIRRT